MLKKLIFGAFLGYNAELVVQRDKGLVSPLEPLCAAYRTRLSTVGRVKVHPFSA
jgi:hypothetical protein